MTTSHEQRLQLRSRMRARRRSLPPAQRSAAAAQFARGMQRAWLLRPGQRIAVYLAYDCEADPSWIVRAALRNGCLVYLPAITDYRRSRMEFFPYPVEGSVRPNRYGIGEPLPRGADRIAVRNLDLILLPLVAVDERGTRLGSGAGFYDRCLHHLRAGRRWRRPKLVGLCYELQRVPYLERQHWDVPLDALLTEKGFFRLRGLA